MSARLRVAVLVRRCMVRGGGAERYAVALIEQLAANHELHVFAQELELADARVHFHLVPQWVQRPRWFNQLQFAWSTWRLTRHGFDVVHSHELSWHGQVQSIHVLPVARGLLGQAKGVRLAWRALRVMLSPRRLTYWWLERARMQPQMGRHIVATSETLARAVLDQYPQTEAALRVVPPGVDAVPGRAGVEARTAARATLGIACTGTWLLFVAKAIINSSCYISG